MDFLVSYIIPFVALIEIVIAVHCLGHYGVARLFGVNVATISAGFGRGIIGYTDKRGTRWQIGVFPFGGYIRVFWKKDTVVVHETEAVPSGIECPPSNHYRETTKRFVIAFSGPIANLLFAILVFAIMFMTVGQAIVPPVVGLVQARSAAEKAGLQTGDRIAAINGRAIARFEEIQQIVRLGDGSTLELDVERDGQIQRLKATPTLTLLKDHFGNEQKMPLLGIGASGAASQLVRMGPGQALMESVRQTWVVIDSTFSALGQMIAGRRDSSELGGPLRIAQYYGQASQKALPDLLYFIALVSISFGIGNLIPFPWLDGKELLICLIELATGKSMQTLRKTYLMKFIFFVFVPVLAVASCNDLANLRVWQFFK